MSVDVNLYSIKFKEFKEDLIKHYPENIKDEKLLEKIMFEFGTLVGENDFIILHNEFYEDGICTWNMDHMIEEVFKLEDIEDYGYESKGKPDIQDLRWKHKEDLISYKEKWEAYENLGLEMSEDDENKEN